MSTQDERGRLGVWIAELEEYALALDVELWDLGLKRANPVGYADRERAKEAAVVRLELLRARRDEIEAGLGLGGR